MKCIVLFGNIDFPVMLSCDIVLFIMQCASCTVAYHVTCAFKFGLEMRTTIENHDRLVHEV